MKKLALLFVFTLIVFQGFSQTIGISYQAVILNPQPQQLPGIAAQGNILANTTVGIQFTIIDASGNEEYQESHTTSTDRYGMLNLLIGSGNPSISTDFSDIFWDETTKKLKVAIDFSGGSNYQPLSEQNLTYMPQPPTEEVSLGIETNTAAILAEQIRATAAEELNATDILSLEAEQQVQNANLATEVTRATTAENAIQADVDANQTADTTLTTNFGNEVTRATTAEGVIQADVDANQTASELADTTLTTDLGNEVTRAIAAEGVNATAIALNTTHSSLTSNPHSVTKIQVGLGNVDNTTDLLKPVSTDTQNALNIKVDENTAITGATKTKITYDAKGLVTSGTNATTSDISEGSNLYYTEARVSANRAVVANTAKAGIPSGGTNRQVLKTNGSGTHSWVNQTTDTDTNTQLNEAAVDAYVANNGYTSYIIGEIKQTIASSMPTGWVKLSGQAISSLSSRQRTQAANLGLSGRLPNATNAYLSQNNATLGSVSGSNSKTIAQNNLPNKTLSGYTNYGGTHTHSLTRTDYNRGVAVRSDGKYTSGNMDTTKGEIDLKYSAPIVLNTAGNHRHSFKTPSINGGVTQKKLNITPYTLSVNTYIYLGL